MAEPKLEDWVRIRSRSPRGFWRCGRHFTPEPVEFPASKIGAGALERLEKDPNLIFERFERGAVAGSDCGTGNGANVPSDPEDRVHAIMDSFRKSAEEPTDEELAERLGWEPTATEREEALRRLRAAEPATPPEGTEARLEAIKAAMAELDKDDDSLFTNDGRPKVPALEKVLGWTPTGPERDQAFALLNKEDDGAK